MLRWLVMAGGGGAAAALDGDEVDELLRMLR
jgi:hypothetical protein